MLREERNKYYFYVLLLASHAPQISNLRAKYNKKMYVCLSNVNNCMKSDKRIKSTTDKHIDC